MNKNVESTLEGRASVARKHAVAKDHAEAHAIEFTKIMMDKLNKENNQLGYLKGDKLTVNMKDKSTKEIDESTSGDWDIWLKGKSFIKNIKFRDDYDNSLKISCKTSTKGVVEEVTVEKIKNINTNGEMLLEVDVDYSYATWSKYAVWVRENDINGNVKKNTSGKLTNFKKAPRLELEPKQSYESNLDTIVKPEQLYTVKSNAGDVKSEYKVKPDFTLLGEQMAKVHVWDAYGEEKSDDTEHNKMFDVKFNIVDITTFKNNNLNKWVYFENPSTEIKFIEGPNNSLTGDISLFSNGIISLIKSYKFIEGAKYKFTANIKPEYINRADTVEIILGTETNKKILLREHSIDLPDVKDQKKGFKEASVIFTVMEQEINSNIFFSYMSNNSGIYIDSLNVEQIR